MRVSEDKVFMSPTPSKIFISYRRTDTGQAVPSLAAALKKAFGPAAVFVDTAAIQVGSQWPQQIDKALKEADILLVVLGPKWLNAGGRHRRLDQETDWVRNEIGKSIRRNIPVIPVLIGGAVLPKPDTLPACLS
jgi:TIR domain